MSCSVFCVPTIENPPLNHDGITPTNFVITIFVNNKLGHQKVIPFDMDNNNPRIFQELLKLSNLNCIILDTLDMLTNYKKMYEIRGKFKQFCDRYDIIFDYFSFNRTHPFFPLIKVQNNGNINDILIVVIITRNMSLCIYAVQQIGNLPFLSYRIIQHKLLIFNENYANHVHQFVQKFHPKIVIFAYEQMPPLPQIRFIEVKNESPQIIVCKNVKEHLFHGHLNYVTGLKHDITVGILPNAYYDFYVAYPSHATDIENNCLIHITQYDIFPIEKTIVITNPAENINFYVRTSNLQLLETIKATDFLNKTIKVTVAFNKESFYEFFAWAVDDITVGYFFDGNLMYNIVTDGKKNRRIQYAHACNVTPCFMAIIDEKVVIGKDAEVLKDERPSFVIYDLLKIINEINGNLIVDPKWGFKIVKDTNNQILLEFDTFRGRRKAPLSYLLSFFLKYSLEQLKNKIGIMPKKVEFGFDQKNANAENIFKVACEKLELTKISFCTKEELVELHDKMILMA